MYTEYYGLNEKPFLIVPNPAYLYMSSKHQNALTYLEYGLSEGTGFILLTGEIGIGKTTLVRHMLNQIESEMDVAVIFNTNINAQQLLGIILNEFELDPAEAKSESLEILFRFLIKRYSEEKRVLLIIDEAQNLSDEVLEEVRMLSNLQSDNQILLQILLVGQPELKERLNASGLAQLAQRITVNYHLTALTRDETLAYIAYRLAKAGGRPDLFTDEAVDTIYAASGGIPRIINQLCDTALVYGFADELELIDKQILEQVIKDKDGIGLYQKKDNKADIQSALPEGDDGRLQLRLKNLEADVQKLKIKIDKHGDEIVKQVTAHKNATIEQLQKLYLIIYKKLQDV